MYIFQGGGKIKIAIFATGNQAVQWKGCAGSSYRPWSILPFQTDAFGNFGLCL